MKKIKVLVIIMIGALTLLGCQGIAINEIYNKSYNIGEIRLDEFEDLIVASIEKASPAVIGVSNYRNTALGQKLIGTGSGVIYSCTATMKDGRVEPDCSKTIDSNVVETYNYSVITNRHVIISGNAVKVFLGQEDITVNATLIQYDDKVDLAVVKFSHHKYIQPIVFADSDQLKSGNFAIAIGNPSGYEFWGSTTFGIVSFPKRYLQDDTTGDGVSDWDAEYIQHDVAINPGNSGGALINIKGELIGINTLKLLSDKIDNMGFAIPSNVVKELIQILETGNKPQRMTLGISIFQIREVLNNGEGFGDHVIPEHITSGLYVTSVQEGRLAYNVLQADDIILKINGVKINYTYEFRAEINKVMVGETVSFNVYRNGEEIIVQIKFIL